MATKPWCYPTTKEFSSKQQWKERKRDILLHNADFKYKFNDSFEQKNAQELLHQFDKKGINLTSQWQCQLRGLSEKEKSKAAVKQVKGKKD